MTNEIKIPTVSISNGNSKMGKIPSVSLPPITTCPKGAPCAKKCYARRLYNRYPSVKSAYDTNLAIFEQMPNQYFYQIDQALKMSRFFRFHVSGDIPTYGYFCQMVELANNNPHCEILAFTKQYEIVNTYLKNLILPYLPPNLHIIFSEWGNQKPTNPYNLPTAAVIFKDTEPLEDWKICGGNCAECACRGVGCWELKKGETIAFYEH